MKDKPYYLSERMRVASENLATLIWIALGVGFLLGLTTNISAAYILEWPHRWLWLLLSVMLTTGFATYVIWRVYSRGYDITSTIEVVLPFCVTSKAAEILIAEPYSVTYTAHQIFQWAMDNEENKSQFLRDWQDSKQPFQGFVRKCVQDILGYVVLDAFREYTGQTLTPKAFYTGHRWRPVRLSMRKLPPTDWPAQLKDNVYLQNTSKSVIQKIELPEGVTLDMKESKGADGTERCEITLSSQYGILSLAFSPYPQKVSNHSREGMIMRKYCGVSEQAELWLAKFSVQISADFGGLRVFGKHFRKAFLPWVEGLFECIKNELDWQLCLERDLERMLVELKEQVRTLLERQSGSSMSQLKEW